jgi:hypothetical protein
VTIKILLFNTVCATANPRTLNDGYKQNADLKENSEDRVM